MTNTANAIAAPYSPLARNSSSLRNTPSTVSHLQDCGTYVSRGCAIEQCPGVPEKRQKDTTCSSASSWRVHVSRRTRAV